MESIRVRIAPSPTGYLHIGTARTALFNYLFARKYGGKFLLRIEDTDIARNSQVSYDSILNGLKFLDLNWDEEPIYQSHRLDQHIEVARKLVENGSAYYCFLSEEELLKRRELAADKGTRYIHRHSPSDEIPEEGRKPVIRMKVPRNIDIVNEDLVQGRVIINSETIEDFVIARSDSSPVYMLSVVCDDIDMKITHIIRGDDHLTNTPKQILIYKALGVDLPKFAHIPLIHGMDGKKLSKRHGALAVEEYIQLGYLPIALRSYLIRLGWGSENDKILTDSEMITEFSLEGINKSPSKFDFEKLNNINHHFLQTLPAEEVLSIVLSGSDFKHIDRIERAVFKIRYRYSTILQMKEGFQIFEGDYKISDENITTLLSSVQDLEKVLQFLRLVPQIETLEQSFKAFLKENNIAFGKIGPAIRLAVIGKLSSVSVFEIIYCFGLEEVIERISSILALISKKSLVS